MVYFRSGVGSLAMVQQWRKAMLARKGDKNLNENVNDQSLFNQVRPKPKPNPKPNRNRDPHLAEHQLAHLL